jgi:hypothetical protein
MHTAQPVVFASARPGTEVGRIVLTIAGLLGPRPVMDVPTVVEQDVEGERRI